MDKYKILKVLVVIFVAVFLVYSTYDFVQIEKKTINVGYLPSNHHAAVFVAEADNMYSKAGLTVNLIPFRSGAEIVDALENGQIDVGYCGIAPATQAISNGADLKIVAPVNTGGSGIVVEPNSSSNISQDLVGKTVAIPSEGSVQDVILHDLLWDYNISSSEMDIVDEEPPLMPAALKNGKIGAYVAWEPYVTIANMTGYGDVLLYSDEWWHNHPCCVVVARDSFIKEHPSELSHLLKIHVKATTFIQNNPEETSEIISRKLGTDVALERESLKHVNFTCYPDQNFTADVEEFMQIQLKLGYINNIPDNESLYDFEFLSFS